MGDTEFYQKMEEYIHEIDLKDPKAALEQFEKTLRESANKIPVFSEKTQNKVLQYVQKHQEIADTYSKLSLESSERASKLLKDAVNKPESSPSSEKYKLESKPAIAILHEEHSRMKDQKPKEDSIDSKPKLKS